MWQSTLGEDIAEEFIEVLDTNVDMSIRGWDLFVPDHFGRDEADKWLSENDPSHEHPSGRTRMAPAEVVKREAKRFQKLKANPAKYKTRLERNRYLTGLRKQKEKAARNLRRAGSS